MELEPQNKRRKNVVWGKKTNKQIIAENSLNLKGDINLQIQEACTPQTSKCQEIHTNIHYKATLREAEN